MPTTGQVTATPTQSRTLLSAERFEQLATKGISNKFDTLLSIVSYLGGLFGLLALIKIFR